MGEYDQLVYEAEVLRSVDLVAVAWEAVDTLTADDIICHLKNINAVADGKQTFNELQANTRLNSNHLNN